MIVRNFCVDMMVACGQASLPYSGFPSLWLSQVRMSIIESSQVSGGGLSDIVAAFRVLCGGSLAGLFHGSIFNCIRLIDNLVFVDDATHSASSRHLNGACCVVLRYGCFPALENSQTFFPRPELKIIATAVSAQENADFSLA